MFSHSGCWILVLFETNWSWREFVEVDACEREHGCNYNKMQTIGISVVEGRIWESSNEQNPIQLFPASSHGAVGLYPPLPTPWADRLKWIWLRITNVHFSATVLALRYRNLSWSDLGCKNERRRSGGVWGMGTELLTWPTIRLEENLPLYISLYSLSFKLHDDKLGTFASRWE